MISCDSRVSVRYAETDQMRVAHHSNYIVWFELARVKLFKKLGIDITELEKQGYFLPVLEVSARYIQPAHFQDELIIRAELSGHSRARVTLSYDVLDDKNKVICKGKTVHGFMNGAGKAVKPPAEFIVNLKKERENAG